MPNYKKVSLYSISLISCFAISIVIFCLPIFPTYVIGATVDGVTELIFNGYSWFMDSNAFLVIMSILPLAIILISFIIQMVYIFKLGKFSKFQSIAFSIPFLFISIFCYMFAGYLAGGLFTAIFIYISIVTNIEINHYVKEE